MTDEWITHASELKVISIVGRLGIGKTCLSYTILEEIKKVKPVFVFKHPRPEIIKKRGYKPIYEFGAVEYLQDCALWLDEPQLFIKTYDKMANDGLERLMTLCRQRNITLLLSTADTRFIRRGLEFYIDLWAVLDIDTNLVKRGSTISKIIQKNALICAREYRLPIGKYLVESRQHFEWNGLYSFNKPVWFNDDYSRPFKIAERTAEVVAEKCAENTADKVADNKIAERTADKIKGDDV